ncbi:protein shisa-5 isoform X3 [Erinaceus europaeus]|uniref:Protein shisa-5 n=1 Tax=Erinaceus europaeus TaxID=9365 RepID=A0ABM3YHX2_ERIEU|nr:protein shisa-5 isoform X3 [Erinaceus europaeus]
MAAPVPAPRILLLLLLLLLPPPPGACHQVCGIFHGDGVSHESCPDFCCGTCRQQYCCSDVLKKFQGSPESCVLTGDRFGASVAIGLTIFVLFIVTIIVCFTCSCCSLYKMCRRPRPIVTTTTATTVVHAPYPQPANMPPSYPGPVYQGYQPMPPQPGLPGAPYPTQYPPPYPAQPMGPPTYHETLAGAAMPYPASQPPYNPAYMDPPKLTH